MNNVFKITKQPSETWREAVTRYSKPFGLETECLEMFDGQVEIGEREDMAAWHALYEWDLVPFEGDATPLRARVPRADR